MKEKNQRNLHETEILEASGLEEQTESSGYFELERKNRKDKPQTVVDYSEDKGLIENEFKQVKVFSFCFKLIIVYTKFMKALYISQNFVSKCFLELGRC